MTTDRAVAHGADSHPTISVITIFFNGERFLEEAIQSVLGQTFTDWELTLVDDGSTDRSAAIAQSYESAYPGRVRYVTHHGRVNQGMSRSRQLGIEQSTGEFIAFLDADDVYLPQKLERQLSWLVRYPRAAMVYGPTPHWYGWQNGPGIGPEPPFREVRRLGVPGETLVEPPTLPRQFLRRAADTPATCGVLVRRAAVNAVGGFEGRFTGLYEDQVFFYKVCLAFPVFIERDAWDRYRHHAEAFCQVQIRAGMHSDGYDPTASRRQFLEWLEGYFHEHDITDRELRWLLYKELWPYRHPVLHSASKRARMRARALGLGRVSRLFRTLVRR